MNYKKFKEASNEYAPYTFFFLNGPFEEEHMLEMAEKMEAKGLSIGYLQDRGISDNGFLTDGFFRVVRKLAENTSISFGLCDETGGMYGNSSMLADMPMATSLEFEKTESDGEYTVPPCFFAVSFSRKNGLIDAETLRIISAGDVVEKGTCAYVFNKYHGRSRSGSHIDYLTPKSADIIIENVYDKLKRNLGEFFGNKISGIFMDIEGDYGYKLAYSDYLGTRYRELFSEDMRKTLPLLIERDADGKFACARYRYYTAVADVYSEFFEKISGFCRENGIEFTGHTWEENLYSQVLQIGDYYKVEKNFSVIGVDSLRLECYSPRDFAEAKTIAAKEDKKLMCEALGCAGNSLSPLEFKRAVNCMTAWGVSHYVIHGIYSERNIGSVGFAPDIFDGNLYFDGFEKISDYIKRSSLVISSTKPCANTVLYNPIDSIKSLAGDVLFDSKRDYVGYISEKRDMLQCEFGLEIEETENSYSDMICKLSDSHIEYFIYDSEYLLTEKFDGIECVIIPTVSIIRKDVLVRLAELAEKGVKIVFSGRTPYGSVENGAYDPEVFKLLQKIKNAGSEFLPSPAIELISRNFRHIVSHRVNGHTHYFWICNDTDKPQRAEFSVCGKFADVRRLSCENGESVTTDSYIDGENTFFAVEFEPYGAYFFEMKETAVIRPEKITLTVGSSVAEIRELVDMREIGGENFYGYGKYTVNVKINKETLHRAFLEIPEVYHIAKVYVNGKFAGIKMWQPYRFDITEFAVNGSNTIEILCGNLLSDSLPYEKYGERWQRGIHRTNPIDSYRSGIFGDVKIITVLK